MKSTLTQALEVAGYMRNNILPSSRVRPSRSRAEFNSRIRGDFYSPLVVQPLRDSGGFNSVIELTASSCLRVAAAAIHPTPLDQPLTVDSYNRVMAAAAPSGALALVRDSLTELTPVSDQSVRLELSLQGL